MAAVQARPVSLDRDATVDRACDLTVKATAGGASLVVFPEAFVPGYPVDPAVIAANRRQFDPVGHYSGSEVFRLEVETAARRPVTFRSD